MTNFRSFVLVVTMVLATTIAMAQGGGKALLWRISGNGLKKASYLFGTADLICPGDYIWTKSMADSFAKSDKICFAANLGDSTLRTQAIKMVMSNGKKMETYFSVVEYPKVKAYAHDTLHLDLDQVQHLKPIAIQPLIIKRLLGCSDAVSYDVRILENAKNDNKEIAGLETIDEEAGEVEETRFNDKIIKTLTDMASGSTYYYEYRTKLMNDYKQQDIAAMHNLFKTNTLLSADIVKVFLDKRSSRWASRMPALMKRSSVFFALNAINLSGEEGVINLLRKAGYKVEPIL